MMEIVSILELKLTLTFPFPMLLATVSHSAVATFTTTSTHVGSVAVNVGITISSRSSNPVIIIWSTLPGFISRSITRKDTLNNSCDRLIVNAIDSLGLVKSLEIYRVFSRGVTPPVRILLVSGELIKRLVSPVNVKTKLIGGEPIPVYVCNRDPRGQLFESQSKILGAALMGEDIPNKTITRMIAINAGNNIRFR